MSLLPLIANPMSLYNWRRPTPPELFDQFFGDVVTRDDLMEPMSVPNLHNVTNALLSAHYLRPWRVAHPRHSGVSRINDDKECLQIILDVQQFKPDELQVKVADGFLVVEGQHEDREDEHGFIKRQFIRRYKLPDNVDAEALKSSLSSDGVLEVCAPKKKIEASPENERPIPITFTQAPAIQNKCAGACAKSAGACAAKKMEQ